MLVVKKEIDTVKIPAKRDKDAVLVEVGALLVGNPNHLSACHAQGFLLISSSISQDFLINIFFYMVSSSKELNEKLITFLINIFKFYFNKKNSIKKI